MHRRTALGPHHRSGTGGARQDTCVYASDACTLYDAIAAPDKTLEFIKADHYLQEPDAARAQTADLISAWVTSHTR